jgi:hypothetical protein
MQFGQGAILEYFAKPTPLFEHEDERENRVSSPVSTRALLLRFLRSSDGYSLPSNLIALNMGWFAKPDER